MKRFTILLLALLSLSNVWADIPDGYYNACNGQKDSLLKQALFLIVRGGDRYEYGCTAYHSTNKVASADTTILNVKYAKGDTIWRKGDLKYLGTWCAFAQTDRHSDGRVWDMYSHAKRYFPYVVGESASGMQIEHCLPKSWWDWNDKDTCLQSQRAYRDLFHLNPADARANGQKSNLPPGRFAKASKFDNGSFQMGMDTVWNVKSFTPQDEYKGDFARAYFYMATAYTDMPWSNDYPNYVTRHSYLTFTPHLIDILLDWHRSDPVSTKEIERANIIYQIQHVRNPYIDYPQLVEYIWGNQQGTVLDLTKLVCTASSSYLPKEDFCDFRILYPDDLSAASFTARWSDFNTTYLLDVYSRTQSAQCDTLVALSAVNTETIRQCPNASTQGKVTASGSAALTLGVSNTDGAIVLTNLALSDTAELVLRASMFQTATSANLRIRANDSVLTTIALPNSHDEIYYRITIPALTDSIQILSVGGNTSCRACVQELYLVTHCQEEEVSHLDGYPMLVNQNSQLVSLSPLSSGQMIYCRVATQDGEHQSPELPILVPNNIPQTLPNSIQDTHRTKKVLHQSNIHIITPQATYSLTGERVQ